MLKKFISRGLFGFPMGLAIGYTFTIITSLIWADGYYAPCMPELVEMVGSEIGAVIVQALLCGLLGGGCAGCSVVWDVETWGLAKQTGIYFLLITVLMMPIAYITYWTEHSLTGIVNYFGMFACNYAVIWLIQYAIIRHNIRKINKTLHRQRDIESK